MAPVREIDVERFRAAVARHFGLEFDAGKSSFLARVLEEQAGAGGAEAYLRRLEAANQHAEVTAALARELTVPETYFFRHLDQFRAFSQVALRERIAARESVRRLSLLSAGCASGEEAYSLAILLKEAGLSPDWGVSLRAVDVNPAALERAARARYSVWSLREAPEEIVGRWFVRHKQEFELDPRVKASVTFERRNLAYPQPDLWAPSSNDVVFCRNVLMYLTAEAARTLVDGIARSLSPGGYLFIGHAETLRGLSRDFDLCESHGAFYYRRRGGVLAADESVASPPCAGWSRAAEPPASIGMDAAAERGELLADAAPSAASVAGRARVEAERLADAPSPAASVAGRATPVGRSAASRAASDVGLEPILEDLQSERFATGLELLGRLSPDRATEPDAMLIRAVLLMHTGRLSAAEQVCEALLAREALCASACHVIALCREAAGDACGAVEHDRLASSLDPTFAMPRLHLGLLARRAGDRRRAHRELERAAELLAGEDPSRILLFGGGFGRGGLLDLCRAELAKGDRS